MAANGSLQAGKASVPGDANGDDSPGAGQSTSPTSQPAVVSPRKVKGCVEEMALLCPECSEGSIPPQTVQTGGDSQVEDARDGL